MHRNLFATACAALVVGLTAGSGSAQNIRYVRADAPPNGNGMSWKNATRSIQQAISSAGPGGQVWVAGGTYRPMTSTIQLFSNVSLYGGFAGDETSLDQRDPVANHTILSGDVLGDDDIGGTTSDNVLVLSAQQNILANTVVDGFTIRSGRASQGGALRCFGSPTFRSCTFTRNNVEGTGALGAAIYCGQTAGSSPRFIMCRFLRNGTSAGGGSLGVFVAGGPGVEARLVGCSFIGNGSSSQGVISIRNGASANIINCAVVSNTIRGSEGVVFFAGTSGSSFLNVINSTIAANTNINPAQTVGLHIVTPASPVLIRNTILWANTAPGTPVERAQFLFPTPTAFRIDYSRVQGWSGQFMGTGTSGGDPMLMDLDGPDDLPGTGDEDVRLGAGSSAIDAGNNFYVWPDIADIDSDGNVEEPTPFDQAGMPRFLDDPGVMDTGVGTPPIVDIGGLEHAGLPEPCRADFNADGVSNSQDFFDFLVVFFAGC